MQIPQDGNYQDVSGENVFVLQIMTFTAIKARKKNSACHPPANQSFLCKNYIKYFSYRAHDSVSMYSTA